MSHVRYDRIFAVGGNSHRVILYRDYTDEQGLDGQLLEVESTQMATVLRKVKSEITAEQLRILKQCMSDRVDVIVCNDGSIGR